MERLEAEPNHKSARYRDRRAESRASLDERAEAEGNEQKLQAAIRGDSANTRFHDLEVTGADGDVVKIDSSDDDPDDIHQAGGHAEEKAFARKNRGHVEHKHGHQNG